MSNVMPEEIDDFMSWEWSWIEPIFSELLNRPLNQDSVEEWLADWSEIESFLYERQAKLHIATTQDTASEAALADLNAFLSEIYPKLASENDKLRQRLLSLGVEPAGMEIPLRNMRVEAELYREANIPLSNDETRRGLAYNKIVGAQTVSWEGAELTLPQLAPRLQTTDRAVREKGWRLAAERRLQDREKLNDIWAQLVDIRQQMAVNAGFADYRAYRWQQLGRLSYTPEDAETFHEAIESEVVPAANRVYDRYRQKLGVARIKPWDVENEFDIFGFPKVKNYGAINDLEQGSRQIFEQIDPALGNYFQTMLDENLIDSPNRKGKGPGAYCAYFPASKRPFIFMNAVGTGDDIRTVLHEAGHAFHDFEINNLAYLSQKSYPMEFAEVASMSMELLATPYLEKENGGFFDATDAARFQLNHLEKTILFWPYMAVVDAFQHWAYTNIEAAKEPANCDACWRDLWQRFIPAIDYSGQEDVLLTGWHRKQHIFRASFYYIEYGLASVGALQVWRNSMSNEAKAVEDYRHALALGYTKTLPELFKAAGANFAFDKPMMRSMVALLEQQMEAL